MKQGSIVLQHAANASCNLAGSRRSDESEASLLTCRAEAAQQAKRAPTLLQKLLVKDIRKDHSHLLQCFRCDIPPFK